MELTKESIDSNHTFGSMKLDDRVTNLPLMVSPWPTLFFTAVYLFLVKLGPNFMANRKPYDIKNILLVYNFSMVVLSGYIFIEFGLSGWFTYYSLRCQPVDTSPTGLRMVNVCWIFYLSKLIELLDTIFFVARKKYNQITFLHVFHHAIMPISWWLGIKFYPGGFGTFHGLLNSWIHFMMYMYYGLAAMGPAYQKYLWWKKYMTKMQITQFIIVCIHSSQLFFMDCEYPVLFAYWIFSYAAIFLVMFGNFYRQAYLAKKEQQQSVKSDADDKHKTS